MSKFNKIVSDCREIGHCTYCGAYKAACYEVIDIRTGWGERAMYCLNCTYKMNIRYVEEKIKNMNDTELSSCYLELCRGVDINNDHCNGIPIENWIEIVYSELGLRGFGCMY